MGLKAASSLQLPTSIETRAFRTIEEVFKQDQYLGPIINKFVSWTDSDDDLLEPAWSLCPFFKMSPFPTESTWITEGLHDMALTLRIQTAVRGTNVDQLMNYWALMRQALFPQTSVAEAEAVRTKLMDAMILRPIIQLNAYGHMLEAEDLRILIADGTIRFVIHVGT